MQLLTSGFGPTSDINAQYCSPGIRPVELKAATSGVSLQHHPSPRLDKDGLDSLKKTLAVKRNFVVPGRCYAFRLARNESD
jgi:hypothetical protein